MASRYNLGLMQDEGLNPFLPYSPTIFVGIIPGSRHYSFFLFEKLGSIMG